MNRPSRRWQAAAGYLVDLYCFASARFVNPHSYLKFLRLNEVRKQSGAHVFIETGTYLGITAYRCSAMFGVVYTIEIEPELAAAAARFLARRQNVQVICGDASVELQKIFESASFDRALVFLDGHFSGGGTGSGKLPEPALEELQLLAKFKHRIGAIVIDDFRSFGTEAYFPSKSELLRAGEELFPEFRLSVSFDQCTLLQPFWRRE